MRALLTQNRDFRRLFLSQLITGGADWFLMVPLLVLLADLTGGGFWGGAVLAVDTGIVALLLPYAGTVADRIDRKRMMIGANLAACVAVCGMFFVRGHWAGPLAAVAVAVLASAKAFYGPAANSALPNLVRPDELSAAMAVAGSTWGTMTVVGSSLGGVLASLVSPYVCFVAVAILLAVSAALSWGIHQPTQVALAASDRSEAWPAIREAIGYLRRRPRLISLVTVKAAVGVGNGLLVAFPLLALHYGVGAMGVGLMYAVRGLGSLLGPFVLRRMLNRTEWLLPGLSISMACYGVAYLAVAAVDWFPLALIGIFVAHAAGGGNWVMSAYAIQQSVPDDLRGRIGATDTMIAMIAVTASQFIAGLLVDSVDTRLLVAGCAFTTLAYAAGWRFATRRIARLATA
ncbi:MAG: MFS transporter [Hamadaea sp.]|uniref:MFS transporter n=1 Tax=Hamadaea sp. TaxID=2024425 RepID=UPI00179E8222|nr:MFS transporter [Hamadaea sp.]NUR72411.1 MFS transporter [Hamadaea sp.]NUT22707.1 MFS transporter [Hamadaea sp.]